MKQRYLIALFLCSLIPWWVGSALTPLLPIYAATLGASPAAVGNYFSFVSLSLALGTAFAGWISTQVPRLRMLMVVSSIAGVISTYLMGEATLLWHLVITNAVAWFAGGMQLTLLAMMAGRHAGSQERGKIFGLLAMTTAIGGVLGGPAGLVVDRWGYGALFAGIAALWLLPLCLVGLLPPDRGREQAETAPGQRVGQPGLRRAYYVLMGAVLCFSVGSSVAILGRSLTMDAAGFSATAISAISALGAVVGMIANPLLGRLSDRVNRRLLLALLYGAGALSLVAAAQATTLVAFALVSMLMALHSAERGISSALVVDLAPAQALNRALSILDSVKWFGGVVGFTTTGYAVHFLGLQAALSVSALAPVLAIVLLALESQLQTRKTAPAPAQGRVA